MDLGPRLGETVGVDVAVIGAGWSGLTAALALAENGIRVTLFEAAAHAGGRARTVTADGRTLDNGQHILLGAYTHALSRLRALHGQDLEPVLHREPFTLASPDGLRVRARLGAGPGRLALALLAGRGLAVTDRLAAVRFVLSLRRPGGAPPRGTVAAQLRGQPPVVRARLWEPLCIAALNTAPEHASAAVFADTLAAALGCAGSADLLLPRADLTRLYAQPALERAQRLGAAVRLRCRVRSLASAGKGVQVDSDAGTQTFEAAVCAVGPQHASRLLQALPGAAPVSERLARLTFEPIATVFLEYAAAVPLPAPMTQLAGSPGQWVFDRAALGAPPGSLAVVVSAARAWTGREPGALVRAVTGQLAAELGLDPPLWARALVERRATVSCTPEAPRDWPEEVAAGVALAGDYTDARLPATLESAVASGERAAARVMAHLGRH